MAVMRSSMLLNCKGKDRGAKEKKGGKSKMRETGRDEDAEDATPAKVKCRENENLRYFQQILQL